MSWFPTPEFVGHQRTLVGGRIEVLRAATRLLDLLVLENAYYIK